MFILKATNVLFLAAIISTLYNLGVQAFLRRGRLNGMINVSGLSFIPNYTNKNSFLRSNGVYSSRNPEQLSDSDLNGVYRDFHSTGVSSTDIANNGFMDDFKSTSSDNLTDIAGNVGQRQPVPDGSDGDVAREGKEVLVFSDFTDLYKNLHNSNSSLKQISDSATDTQNSTIDTRDESTFYPIEYTDPLEHNAPDAVTHTLARRKYEKRLFKKLPQIVDTSLFLVRSKAYVKGRIGSKCDLSVFDSNRESLDGPDQKPFASIGTVLPGVFTGLHTLKHTKKRIIRELKVKLDLYVKTLSSQLKNVIEFYKQLVKYIHPFQYNLFRTTIHDLYATGESKVAFDDILERMGEAKKRLVSRGKEINRQLNSTGGGNSSIKRCREAFDFVKVNIFQLDALYSSFQSLYDQYSEYYRVLAKLPVVDIEKPIVAIIGHVNIGKTTLYNRISESAMNSGTHLTGTGEVGTSLGLMWSNLKATNKQKAKVADYKFTTRGINKCTLTYGLNNFMYEGQLIDTPGLLWREGHTNFNPYERLTYSVLKDLPSGVLFCFDTSNSLDEQISLYTSLRNRFPRRPWLNVVVKGNQELSGLVRFCENDKYVGG
ncbi:uncharacterized protein TOT_020000912 [Theileria orientalis strain Shintoku]|uniref:Nucleolar GTP-binding protein 1 Rossman-fold domain-containing protein n=1 Tax=Theileria orientalis strain Shintoku TaxID=869250 RepID=J4C8E7_THEOR|nr:uncharacterized protein TOT_020000912 [Theileria orientalis strain Shintoku]BAM40658.1 uncharacterized protein TOT_020000912 [Theileria orientalis strain Shintoku]|eukprot:XP_009690959.1 uncharacterized protein TOT_020000912 [Theileria orientalis strain Shintoku]